MSAPAAELVDQLIHCASRAPSPHNAQGWRIEWTKDRFTFRLDGQHRVLRELDPRGLEGELACGAAIANLEVAAAALGYAATVHARPSADDDSLLAEVTLVHTGKLDESRLVPIRERAMNRSAYKRQPVDAAVLEELRQLAAAAGFELSIKTGVTEIAEIARVAGRAGCLKLMHEQTGAELHQLMRFTAEKAASTRDGLDLSLFDVAPAAAKASSVLFHPSVLSRLPRAAEALARKNEQDLIASSPAVCLLTAASDGRDAFLDGGRAFQRLALRIAERGLSLQPHSAAIEVALGLPGDLDPGLPAQEVRSIDEDLRAAFGVGAMARPIVLFRLGVPTRMPERRSLRRTTRAELPAAGDAHYSELTRRNQPAVSPEEQQRLGGLRVLFAGCGSIGGAPVEVLARMGLRSFLLAEPGTYELNNLNRQAATLADVGRNKAEVLRDRVHSINPDARVLVDPHGVTEGNVDWLVGATDLIIDGVDVTEGSGIAAKRLLHEEAWKQRRVVIIGLDLGSTQLVKVYDYRDPKVRPFDGRLDGQAKELNAVQLLSRLIEPLDLPLEMVSYTEAAIRGVAGSAPQLAPTANLFGVLAAWAVLDYACGRSLKKRVRVDTASLWMPLPRRVANEALRVAHLARLKILFEMKRVANAR